MKKKSILMLLLVQFGISVWAQNEKALTEAESQKVVAELTEAAASMQTLQCCFVQEKTSTMLMRQRKRNTVQMPLSPLKRLASFLFIVLSVFC